MTTGDNYPDLMWSGMDAVGTDVAPERVDFAPTTVFFILWTLVGTFMGLNLFVAMSISKMSLKEVFRACLPLIALMMVALVSG